MNGDSSFHVGSFASGFARFESTRLLSLRILDRPGLARGSEEVLAARFFALSGSLAGSATLSGDPGGATSLAGLEPVRGSVAGGAGSAVPAADAPAPFADSVFAGSDAPTAGPPAVFPGSCAAVPGATSTVFAGSCAAPAAVAPEAAGSGFTVPVTGSFGD